VWKNKILPPCQKGWQSCWRNASRRSRRRIPAICSQAPEGRLRSTTGRLAPPGNLPHPAHHLCGPPAGSRAHQRGNYPGASSPRRASLARAPTSRSAQPAQSLYQIKPHFSKKVPQSLARALLLPQPNPHFVGAGLRPAPSKSPLRSSRTFAAFAFQMLPSPHAPIFVRLERGWGAIFSPPPSGEVGAVFSAG
jgi:hypothetical protein